MFTFYIESSEVEFFPFLAARMYVPDPYRPCMKRQSFGSDGEKIQLTYRYPRSLLFQLNRRDGYEKATICVPSFFSTPSAKFFINP